ncbi:PfkB family carbohydrate kinase [candidate division KSB1 bacterium]
MSLLVVGSIAFDTIETESGRIEKALGGSAVHFSSSSSFFSQTRLVGVVGEDFDLSLLDFLKERGTDLGGIETQPGKTFHWSGKYHTNMNERDTLVTELNVFENFNPNIPETFKESEFIFLANIDPSLQLNVLEQVKNPSFTALDTMNFWIEGSRPVLMEVLKKVDAVILNDTEAQQFSEEYNIAKAAKFIVEHGPRIVVIKKGEHGSMLYYDGEFFVLPAFVLENVFDPTGAGDSFAGGFVGFLAKQQKITRDTLRSAMAYGTCVASFCCEEFGVEKLAKLDKKEISNRFDEFRKIVEFPKA